ncbi:MULTISPECIES: branched-chain amino acid aminotransferase [Pandoraea]|jgi:branched-chain amino acid aminotransferase|uniref:Branched-chain-amino-acid aminotransferase n=1 Tax=Pandoraea pnomenusa TaxID=93220 RepID=A0A378YRT4_9BURK|nr:MULTISPECIES: branched-chain amino acid aminotransferase [Pandoraea]AHB07443.2 branched-chain amino acid aminotransferase [Pandoraea pnomenusa 3kgm]AHB76363.1 branched chain amino acid aminotransferase [Pandoraea pnomenusa]AHN75313.1 branched chain amino acid aminotransferase [Pandoraea pnomenusa]AIU28106.1 branched chain amino acid aminotransferase [Pandoraea pnomenusa]ANC45240.1 branched chain amino acid aminotransferase [Pandoraea pnomenusa]
MSADNPLRFVVEPHANPTPADQIAAKLANPVFGRVFTDHMVTIRWTEGTGWHDAKVEARRPFQIDPACAVLHYAQEIFEGMKAYRGEDGKISLFRPQANARRFRESAQRMSMADLPEAVFLEAVEKLVDIDRAWIPSAEGSSLYIRPFMFASESFLGVRAAHEYIFCVIACPVGPYFKPGKSAVTVWVSDQYTRAAPGGTGAAKCGGNYAASLIAQTEASAKGCDQVVFLDAAQHRWIEELGGMNVFFVMDDGSLQTPPLSGTILPGITRASIIEFAKREGLTVNETPYEFAQWQADAASGRVKETFACGTAAVVTAIGQVRHANGEFAIGDGGEGPVTKRIRDQLTGIQRGKVADPFGWVHHVA